MTTISFTVAALRAAASHMADQDVRYYLNGVYVDTERGRLVATDGHRMMVVRISPNKDIKPFIMRDTFVNAVLKAMTGKKYSAMLLDVDVEDKPGLRSMTANTGTSKIVGEELDGKFPEYDKVTPKSVSGEKASFNAEYLRDAQRALNQYTYGRPESGDKSGPYLAHNGLGPAVMMPTASDELFAIIMPLRASIDDAFVNQFLSKI